MSDLAAAAREALAEGGALADAIPAFVPRAAQQRLAAAVADAFDTRGTLLAEAGTGTGKTYAYLVPALLSGLKTIVSTGTRALQDQLYLRDLPRVRDALGTPIKTALLKGRANYLCKHRLERAKGEPRFANREQIAQFQRIVAWSGRTRMGDMAELDALPEDSPLLPMVTSTAENCLGSECPFWSDCFVVQARAARAGGGHRRRQPPSAARRPGAEAGRLRRNPAGRAGLRGRRSAPVAGSRRAVLRRRRWARGRWSNSRATRSPNART